MLQHIAVCCNVCVGVRERRVGKTERVCVRVRVSVVSERDVSVCERDAVRESVCERDVSVCERECV